MNWLEIAKVIKEIGLAAGAFALCAWMVVYIVKRLASNIDRMITKQEIFMERVRAEHMAQIEDHKEFSIQNKEITAALGRINGFRQP